MAHQDERSGSHSLFVNHGVRGIGRVIDCCRFSSLERLLKVTSYALRFIGNLESRIINSGELRNNDICTEENESSKILWLRYERHFIRKEEHFSKVKNSLNLIEDDKGLYVLIMSRTRFRVNPHAMVA